MHGSKIVCRRTEIAFQTDYHNYLSDLRTDFHYICGYCGKHEMISHKGMEIDHFVPKSTDRSRECDYSNLVYSCFTCNRKKSGKWPTCDKDKPNDDDEGFIDPATPDFDAHLGRGDDGTIEYYTSVGEYMYKKAFKFDIRPTKAIWQASMLHELKENLKIKIEQMSQKEQYEQLFSLISELDNLQKYLFEQDE
ncbi:HNH endonuclease [Desulfitobacterium hafniense]|uniref:HNH endonuclease n=1 Tax=Desulfitobacterium hafniense TaxID=49338 RepID=UPI00249E69CC|nr:HNH endonuclease signature motif containing protein [Desulfitobacterium hafniense]